MLANAGFEAIATSSGALAATLGRSDGRHEVTRDEHLEHAGLLGRLTGLPVDGDFEDGYGDTPGDVAATVEAAVEFGLAGIGVEDTSGNPDQPIRDFDEAVNRIRSAVDAAKGRIVVTGPPTTSSRGGPISTTPSGVWRPSLRSARMCSTPRTHPTSTRLTRSSPRSRRHRSTSSCHRRTRC
jgi:hypothetical protein